MIGRPHELLPWLKRIPRPARMVYEAGPTGYGLVRRARAAALEIAVCAPTRTDRRPGDRTRPTSATRSVSRGCSPLVS